MKSTLIFAASLLLSCLVLAEEAQLDPLGQWPQWRGPLGTGVAPHGDPPAEWSEEKNVRFKLELPGKGHSTPIIWGDRLFLTTAVAVGDKLEAPSHGHHDEGAHDNLPPDRMFEFNVLAIDRHKGKVMWQKTVRREQPHEASHVTGSWASNSAVTDGHHLFAYFGSRGLYALDFAGELVWEKDLGDMLIRHEHGEGSSPALYGDTLVVNWDHQGESFVVALDKRNGKERWRAARDEITSWATPIVVDVDGKPQAVVSATERVRGYDLVSGKVIWESGGLSRNVVASPVAADGMVFVGNSYDWQAMLAIRLADAKGDVTESDAVVWKIDRYTPYVPSPLLYDGMLFFLMHSHGVISNLDAASGKPHFGPERLRGIHNVFASPVGAGGRVYIVSREGTTAVLARGSELEVVAFNRLDDSFSASPAVAGKELYLRGERHLYGIATAAAAP